MLLLFLVALVVLAMQYGVRGDRIGAHSEAELFGVFFAFSIFFLAASKFVASRDRAYLAVALGFFAAAMAETLHAVAYRDETASPARLTLMGYTWWIGRLAFCLGILIAARWVRYPGEARHPAALLWRGAVATAVAVGLAVLGAATLRLPQYYASGLSVGRVMEAFLLLPMLWAFFWLWRARDTSSEALRAVGLVSVAVGVVTQLFSIASAVPLDKLFFAAHLIKVGSYSVVLFGLYADHANLFTVERGLRESLERANVEVTRSKRELEGIFDNLNEGIAIADRQARLVRFNKAAQEITGRDAAGQAPEAWVREFRVETPEGRPLVPDHFPLSIAVREGRRVRDVEMVVQRPNGERRTILVGAIPLFDGDARIGGAVANFHDVTEIRKAEQTYRDLSERAPDGVIVMDQDGRIRYFNAAAERMFDYAREEVNGRDVTFLVPERYRAALQEARRARLKGGHPEALKRTIEAHGLRKSGKEFPIEVSLSAVRSGNEVRFIGNLRDTSVKGRAKREQEGVLKIAQALTTTETLDAFLQEACRSIATTTDFDASTIFLFDADRENLLLRASEKIPEEVIAVIRRYPVRPETRALAVQCVLQDATLVEPHLQSRLDLVVKPDLSRKYGFQVVLSAPIRFSDRILGVLQVIADQDRHPQEEDIHVMELLAHELGLGINQKALIQRLEDSTQRLGKANQELDSFIYTASHDLSEPLRSITNFSHFLLEDYATKLEEEGRDHLQRVHAGALRMKRLLDDLLRLSRFGRHQAQRERLHLDEIVREVQESLDASLRERQAEIIVKAPLPELRGDRTSLVEVLSNLISNGIKFNDQPRPRVEIGAERRNGGVEVYVRDNGIGIPAEHQDRIFGLFTRLHTRKEYPGTGAGLAIVKKIVETQGGRLRVESAPGQGSTFYFTIPASDGRA